MERGWSAEGLLQPLWHDYPGGRDALAEQVGTKPTVLSSINSGKRNLGTNLGGRLALELGVSLLELGAPLDYADEQGRDLLYHLQELRAELEVGRTAVAKSLEGIRLSLARIEARLPREGEPSQEASK